MITLTGMTTIGGQIHWQIFDSRSYHVLEGFTINFPFYSKISLREGLLSLEKNLIENKIDWIYVENKLWKIDLDILKKQAEVFQKLEYLEGKIIVQPEIEHDEELVFNKKRKKTYIKFIVTVEEIMESKPKKIFLSHKGIDKPIVRDYKKTLEILGYEPWLDEDSLVAGKELERGLLQGFKESCAAVFFITSNFIDESFLASEVNYAIAEKRIKGDRFSIITIVLPSSQENYKIPDLLQTYVWKQPTSDLEAIREIIKALPLKYQGIIFK